MWEKAILNISISSWPLPEYAQDTKIVQYFGTIANLAIFEPLWQQIDVLYGPPKSF